jgi:hypothetical protein
MSWLDRILELGDPIILSEAPVPLAPEFIPEPLTGDQNCSEKWCGNTNGAECAYVARSGERCLSAWCPEHREIVEGRVYCRRHAGIVKALLLQNLEIKDGPELENRAASLCEWVANTINDEVSNMLTVVRIKKVDVALTSDDLSVAINGPPIEHIWNRGWKLVDHTGALLRVSIEVTEEKDGEVIASVNKEEVFRSTPPWVGEPHEASDRDRENFNSQLLSVISTAITFQSAQIPGLQA